MSQKNQPTDLNEFLKMCRRKEGQDYTHTKIGDPNKGIRGGSYVIDKSKEELFLDLYYNEVFVKNRKCYLTERHIDKGPITIDLDFRFKGEVERKYNNNFIVKFINIYLEQLTSIIDVPHERISSFIMEKPDAVYKSDKDFTKDGLHIIFPHIIVSPNLQYAARYKTITNKKCKELFDSIDIINPVDDVFDRCVIERNNWQMYGSCKPNSDTYKLTQIIDGEGNLTDDISNYSDKDLIKLLTVRHYHSKYNYNLSEEEIGAVEEIISKIPV